MNVDTLFHGGPVATMADRTQPYGLTDDAVGVTGATISYIGPASGVTASARVDLEGRLLTPGLIDCHTHAVFGGERISEFEQRLRGASYAELAEGGGGIVSTVRATRAASDDDLFEGARDRILDLMSGGVSTVEIKSGYGLTTDDELRMLRVARRLGAELPVRVVTSLLAAHAIPPEFRGRAEDYTAMICDEIIPAAADEGLADSVDAFLETIAFDRDQVDRVLATAHAHHLAVRLHADQLSDGNGARLAAEHGALSADHLEHASTVGIEAMAAAGTVAVVIPGASVFLDEPAVPPIRAMREAGIQIAVATDLNPGTSPVISLQTAMWLASARFRLTPEETLAGTTRNAAAALGLADTGTLVVGNRADLAIWDVDHPAALSYWVGPTLCRQLWRDGERIYWKGPE
jgi:imidazolonepropionase